MQKGTSITYRNLLVYFEIWPNNCIKEFGLLINNVFFAEIKVKRTWNFLNEKSYTQRRKTETKPDTYSKDRIFVTSFAFCVITYEPIEVQTFSAPQNDRQNLVFVKDIKVVVEKMTRNRRKVIGKPGDSLLCRLHSIQLSSLVYSFLYVKNMSNGRTIVCH